MRLKSIKLTHFSGYRATAVIPIDEAMAGIVGRNDYDKSTILEALAIFFETGGAKADKSASAWSMISSSSRFDNLPAALVLDEKAETSLAVIRLLAHSDLNITSNAMRRPPASLMNSARA